MKQTAKRQGLGCLADSVQQPSPAGVARHEREGQGMKLDRRDRPSIKRLLSAVIGAAACAAMATQPVAVRDDNLKLPAAWKTCEVDEQCVRIPNGCDETAVNASNEKAARAHSLRVAGDPRAMSCVRRDPKTWSAPVCLEKTCTLVRAVPTP